YCCAGSLLRLVNGKTTIDRRGAMRGCAIDVAAATAAAVVGLVVGQSHHAPAATTRTAATAAAAISTAVRRPRRAAAIGTSDFGKSEMVSGRSAKTRTGRSMFLTRCSPISTSG